MDFRAGWKISGVDCPGTVFEGCPLESEQNEAKRFTAGRYRAGLTPSRR
jgi:hypothetical protein